MSSRRSSACTSGHLATPAAPSPQPPTKVERRIFVTPGPSPTRRDRPGLVPRRRAPPRLSSADHKVLRAPGLSSRVPSTALLVLRANINCARRGACARQPGRVGGPRLEPSSSSSSWLGRDSSRCQWAVRRTSVRGLQYGGQRRGSAPSAAAPHARRRGSPRVTRALMMEEGRRQLAAGHHQLTELNPAAKIKILANRELLLDVDMRL